MKAACAIALCLVPGFFLIGCAPPQAPAQQSTQAKAPSDKSVDEGYPLNGSGGVLRCRTPDGGFTTICRPL
jgi:hypothetical protein